MMQGSYLIVVVDGEGPELYSVVKAKSMGEAMAKAGEQKKLEGEPDESWFVFHGCEIE